VLEFWPELLYVSPAMRLTKGQIEHLGSAILRNLSKEGKVIIEDRVHLLEEITTLMTDEFQKEDRLDQEVREILNRHMEKIRRENIEYQQMFKLIKTKLAREKGIVL
jgi:hypothetical protein